VAVAGPYLKDQQDFAVALTNYAAEHYVGGRALVPGGDTSSTLGILLPIDSPFTAQGEVTDADIVAWLNKVEEHRADIVVLDYGTASEIMPEHRAAIRRLAKTALVVAAAGNTGGRLMYPARDDSALAVGALSSPTEIADYSALEPRRLKPELFALETLEGTALKDSVTQINPDGSPARGTSFAAILVAAGAVLVWATQPERDPKWVRTVLFETATELPSRYKRFRLRAINVPAALNRAREDLVTETLRVSGRLTLPELLAGVGLPTLFTDRALKRLVDREIVAKSLAGGAETYDLI
jgi:subtilisin family serine protease